MNKEQRYRRGMLITDLAKNLTELDVDFRGILVRLDEYAEIWTVQVEFDPTAADSLEHCSRQITTEGLLRDFNAVVRYVSRVIAEERKQCQRTATSDGLTIAGIQ